MVRQDTNKTLSSKRQCTKDKQCILSLHYIYWFTKLNLCSFCLVGSCVCGGQQSSLVVFFSQVPPPFEIDSLIKLALCRPNELANQQTAVSARSPTPHQVAVL